MNHGSVWERIRGYLENEKRRIDEEIKNYPPPIPACDVQFNRLLEERTRVSEELRRMHEAREESHRCGHSVELLNEFIRSSSCMDDEAKQRMSSYLNGE
jgi:hypothetical protein